jgi:hypothetical protein
MSDLARAVIIEGSSGLLAIVSIFVCLAILLNIRGLTTKIINRCQRLGMGRLGWLFRGEYSLGFVRLLSAGLVLLALQPIGQIPQRVGTQWPTGQLLVLFAWTYMGYVLVIRARWGSRRMVPPIGFVVVLLLVGAYIGDSMALSSLPRHN